MRTNGMKAFWLAFWTTMAILAPLLGYTLLQIELAPAPAASSKADVPIATPTAENRLTLLAVSAGAKPAFVLIRLDAPAGTLQLAALPAESVVKNGQQTLTLADCYAAAGPARAAALLSETLGLPIDRYLAATPAVWEEIGAALGTVRVGLSGALTADQLAAAGVSGTARTWDAAGARALLETLAAADPAAVPPAAAAAARAALWQGWARQKLDALAETVPAILRSESGTLLTDLSATDLLTLQQTLEFLAQAEAEPAGQVLPGRWDAAAGQYAFTDETLAWLAAFAPADDTAASGSSAPAGSQSGDAAAAGSAADPASAGSPAASGASGQADADPNAEPETDAGPAEPTAAPTATPRASASAAATPSASPRPSASAGAKPTATPRPSASAAAPSGSGSAGTAATPAASSAA